MPTGIVKWFNGRKGYGFIEPEDGGNDVFVHVTAVKDSGIKFLNEGDKVSYELTENRGRMAAGNLTLDGESSTESVDADDDQVEESAAEESSELPLTVIVLLDTSLTTYVFASPQFPPL